MISDAEIAAARAALPSILPTKLRREGKLLRGLCPVHNEKTPSFIVDPADWHYHCFSCGAHGDAITWIECTKGLTFPDAVRELIDGCPGKTVATSASKKAPHSPEAPSLVLGSSRAEPCTRDRRTGEGLGLGSGKSTEASDTARRVQDLWRTATAPRIAQFYLESRGVAQKVLPAALRGARRVWCAEVGEYRPTMLAAITDAAGRITAVQRTYLEDRLVYDGETEFAKGARASLKDPKMTLGPMGNGSVKLAAAGEVLGLSEGVESGMAAAKLFRLPVWSLCGLSRCGRPAGWSEPKDDRPPIWLDAREPHIDIPTGVRRIVFFGDNGKLGHKIADYACWWWRRQGLAAQAEYPEERYGDWAEALAS